MTPEQQAAYIFAQSACMLAEMEGMKAANAERTRHDCPPLYSMEDFDALPNKYGVHHNTVIGWFTGR